VSSTNALPRGRLALLENVAQTIGTMGPTATLGTILPLLIAKSGNGAWLVCLIVLAVFMVMAVSICVFTGVRSSAGSLATYARMGLGRWPGILAGWSYAIAMVFVAASSAVSSAYYASLATAHFTHAPLGIPAAMVLVTAVVLLAWWPSHRDVRFSAKVMLGAEVVSVALIFFILSAAMLREGHWVDHAQLRLEGADFSHVRLGFVLAFLVLAGFESATTLSEESQDSKHVLPRVMLGCLLPTGLLFVLGIYCLGALSHAHSLALDQTTAPFDVIATSVGLPALGWISSVGIALSCYGCAVGGFNAGSRVLYAMARTGLFWRSMRVIHPVNATPYRTLALLAGIAIAMPATMLLWSVKLEDTMDYLMQLASFGFLTGYLAVCLAAPVYLARKSSLRLGHVAAATVALSAIGATWVLSVVPLPDPPWRYLPWIFLGLLAFGSLLTVLSWRRRSPRGEGRAKSELVVADLGKLGVPLRGAEVGRPVAAPGGAAGDAGQAPAVGVKAPFPDISGQVEKSQTVFRKTADG
jgi:amino acid transporter